MTIKNAVTQTLAAVIVAVAVYLIFSFVLYDLRWVEAQGGHVRLLYVAVVFLLLVDWDNIFRKHKDDQ